MDKPASVSDEPDTEADDRAWDEGVRAVEEGRAASHEDVKRWLLSWGTENELPRPKCEP